jgi:hypothetical protein
MTTRARFAAGISLKVAISLRAVTLENALYVVSPKVGHEGE